MSEVAITFTKIYDLKRTEFMPKAFSKAHIEAEKYIFGWMIKYDLNYNGGTWDFYETGNGAYYVTPPRMSGLQLPNYVEGIFTTQESGIIVTLATYGYLAAVAHEAGDEDLMNFMVTYYWLLRDFVDSLPPETRSQILRAID